MQAGNFDPKDPLFISLKEELERLVTQKNRAEIDSDEMIRALLELSMIYTLKDNSS